MSLIYAHKANEKVRVLSDTKIYVDPDYKQQLEHSLTEEEMKCIIKYGMIKTVIYKNSITISSAGNIEVFNELLKRLHESDLENVDDILNITLTIHNNHHNNTDFIITTDKDIYCIKSSMIEKVENAWIGDSDAFNKFQELRLTAPRKTMTVITENGNFEEPDEYSSIYDAFKNIVKENLFEKVGGMAISCAYSRDSNKFSYDECFAIYTGYNYKRNLKPGESLVFEASVEDGGFSYYGFNMDKYYAMDIIQSDKYLVYKPGYSNGNYKYLLLPTFINKN